MIAEHSYHLQLKVQQLKLQSFFLSCCRLFEIDPQLVELFPFRDEEISINNEGMRKHGLGVMETIDAAITMVLEGNIEELVCTLTELGMVHSIHNVDPQHFGVSTTTHNH